MIIRKTADGFLTVRTKDYLKNQYSVHMYHLKEKEFPNESNLLFLCGKTDEHTADTFDRLGCNILSMCSDCSLIVMDELGPHEADAALFRKKNLKPFGWADSHFRGITGTCRIFLA